MGRVTRTKDLNPELWKIFDEYVHGFIDRRGFMDRAAKYVAAPMTAAMALDLMNPRFAEAQQVKPDDKRIKTEWVEIDSPKGYGKIKAYVCKPANATGKLPTVLVIHENRGLNPHIEDIARRLAVDNFLAVAPGLERPNPVNFAIAFSQLMRLSSPVHWGTPRKFAPGIIQKLLTVDWPPGVLMNVNFPHVADPKKVLGIRSARHAGPQLMCRLPLSTSRANRIAASRLCWLR